MATLYTGPIGGGAVYGAVSSSTTYGLEVASGEREASLGEFAKTVGTGTLSGAAGGAAAWGGGKLAAKAASKMGPRGQQVAGLIDENLRPQKGPLAKGSNGFPKGSSFYDDTLPPDRGFAHEPLEHVLRPGVRIDRYGAETGKFVSPPGTPFGMRSLPEYARNQPLYSYEVVQPLPVRTGLSTPWYGQQGLGVQHELPGSIEVLIKHGFLRRL